MLGFRIPDLAGVVNVFGSQTNVIKPNLFGFGKAAFSVGADLAPRLRRVIFVSDAAVGERLNFKRVGLRVISLGDDLVECARNQCLPALTKPPNERCELLLGMLIMANAVAYYRVSTRKQSLSGLGSDAQKAAVEALCKARGLNLIAPPFEEVESGKRADRPELMKALERCKVTGATLVVAKLDRLSRSVAFLAALQDSGAKFIAADMPEANELTVHILAAVAQAERKAISTRTKEALAAAKARGQTLGNPNGAAALRRAGSFSAAGVATIKRRADDHANRLRPIIARLRKEGAVSTPQIADALNRESVLTPRGAKWYPSSVRNLLARLDA